MEKTPVVSALGGTTGQGNNKMLYFITGNKNKLREFEEILGFKLKNLNLDLDEIQAIEVEKVIEHKAREAFKKIKKPLIVEDTGLYFEAWNGMPGALSKLFDEAIGYNNLCKLLKNNRKAKAKTVIGYFDGRNYRNFVGEISGAIAMAPRGRTNFGWDAIFIPLGHKKTFAQMKPIQKNKISMRKIALEKFRKFING